MDNKQRALLPFEKRPEDDYPDTKKDLQPWDYSDAGNAERFCFWLRVYTDSTGGRYLLHSDLLGWMVWDGHRWAESEHEAMKLAIRFTEAMKLAAHDFKRDCEDLMQEAEQAQNEEAVKDAKKQLAIAEAFHKHAVKSRSAARIKAILELAKPELHISADAFDAEAATLNTPAGLVDLRAGTFRPPDPTALCTKMTTASRSSDGAELWTGFLQTVTCDDAEKLDYLQQVIGMALYGKVYEEGLFLAHGGGRNGKSTLFNALSEVMGDYAGTVDSDIFTATYNGKKGFELYTLRGKRLIVAGEFAENRRLASDALKRITSTDPIQAERKHHDAEMIVPSHTVFLFTNNLLRISSRDDGTWRRVHYIPFNARIADGETVSNYASVLAEKAGGAILTWAVEGAKRFAGNGYKLQTPQSIQRGFNAYRRQEDWLQRFIGDCCELPSSDAQKNLYRARAGRLYETYQDWAKRNGETAVNGQQFHKLMEAAGFESRRPGGARIYVGIQNNYDLPGLNTSVG